MDDVPKIIWILWLQGWDSPPPIVTACKKSWIRLNPGWEVRALDQDSVRHWLPDLEDRSEIPLVAFSDLVRLELLSSFGGVWVDATTFCWAPLDEWLPPVATSGFFAFRDPAPDRPLASWFLASAKDNAIVAAWSAAASEYWNGRDKADQYFWVHQLFKDLIRENSGLAEMWRSVPARKADGPHYFVPYGKRFTGSLSRRAQARLESRTDPLYKLTYRFDASRTEPGSALQTFLADSTGPLRESAVLRRVDRTLEEARWALRDTMTWTKARVRSAG